MSQRKGGVSFRFSSAWKDFSVPGDLIQVAARILVTQIPILKIGPCKSVPKRNGLSR